MVHDVVFLEGDLLSYDQGEFCCATSIKLCGPNEYCLQQKEARMSTASAVEVIHNPVCQQQLTSGSAGAVRFGSTGAVRFGSTGAVHFGLGCQYKVPPCHCVKSMLRIYMYDFPGMIL